jgi:Holliday junction resolvase RusA-like endonuclease
MINIDVVPYEPTTIDIGIRPMGAVRTTKRAAGKTDAGKRYAAYKDAIAWQIKQHIKKPYTKAVGVPFITFHMPIPESKKGKVKPGDYHTVKPDIDNLIKGLFDAANGIAWIDDNRVAELGIVKKIYSDNPRISFEIKEIGGLSHGQKEVPEQTERAKRKAERKEKSRERRFNK